MKFLKYSACKVRDKLLKIMDKIFEKGEVLSKFRKIFIRPLCKKCHKSGLVNYTGLLDLEML